MQAIAKWLGLGMGLSFCAHADDSNFSYNIYGSLRMQAESVMPDNTEAMSRYKGLRDAYSRLGFHAQYDFTDRSGVFAQLEIPFDSVNFRFRDSYDQGGAGRNSAEDIRVAKLGFTGPVGTITAGQQWMPYYNAITFPVDQFSSFYSGFATYTTFRVKETLAYETPAYHGLSVTGSYSSSAGNIRSPSRIDDRRIQAAIRYQLDDTQIAIGLDDRGNAAGFRDHLYGISLAHHLENWTFAAKFETTDTNNPDSFYGDGAKAINLYTAYQQGKNTYKIMLADVEGYGEMVLHLGMDHRINNDLRLFVEYYQEQETAALTGKHAGVDGFNADADGGKILLMGFRYDFGI